MMPNKKKGRRSVLFPVLLFSPSDWADLLREGYETAPLRSIGNIQ
jgi:hypothetical protein